jgi:uncharacterized protein
MQAHPTPPNSASIRPIYLLALLGADKCAPIEGRTRLVKLVFLVEKKVIEELRLGLITQQAYTFRALNYGPFTEEVYDDLTTLQLRGLAEVTGDDEAVQNFHLTDKGRGLLSKMIDKGTIPMPLFSAIQQVKQTYGSLPLDRLIERVYKQYPEYTGRSLIKDKYSF